MTSIQDHTNGSDASRERDVAQRIDQAGQRTEDASRRIAAAIAGALEGFVEALDRYDVANEGRQAIRNAGEVTRAAAVEGKEQAQSPEMQQVGHGLRVAGEKASEVGHNAAGAMRSTADAAQEKAHSARETMHDAVESAKYAAYRAKEEVKVRADAVAESGRRARHAPGNIRRELSEAFTSWKRALLTSIAMMLTLVIFSAIALIVLTIALVVGLNALIGDPAGTFVVALAYVVIAGIAWAVARSAKTKAAHEREERMENVREEVRHVVRPVRDAFGKGRTGY